MKKGILFFGTIAIIAIVFSACKKDDPAPSTKERIQTKWVFEKTYSRAVIPFFGDIRDTIIGVAGDYVDFRTDNKVYSRISSVLDTLNYSIVDDSKMIIDGDTATIQVINDTQFQLYSRSGNYPTAFEEATIYLKK